MKAWLSDKNYDFIFSRVPRLGVDLILEDKKGTLLSLRQIEPYKGYWHLPGGRVHFRESLYAAARRIGRDETGLVITPQQIAGVMEFPRETQKGQRRHTVSIALFCTTTEAKIQGSWQAKDLRFFKTPPPKTIPAHKKLLRRMKKTSRHSLPHTS